MTNFLDFDPHTGITETFHKDAMTGIIKVNKSQDTQPTLDSNKMNRSHASTGWKEQFHKVASIPPIVIEIWREELKAMGGVDPNPLAASNKQWFIAKLNSSDFQKLRTKEGVI